MIEKRPRCRTRLSAATAGLALLSPRLSHAEAAAAAPLHRLSIGGGYALVSYTVSQHADSEALRDKHPTGTVRLAYGYLVAEELELGGALTATFTSFGVVLLPAGAVRAFVTLGERTVDIGASARIGAMLAPESSDLGWSGSAGPEVRVWATPSLAFSLGASATIAIGSSSSSSHSLGYLSLASLDFAVCIAP